MSIKSAEIKSSLFKMTWPLFIELLLQMFVGNIDQIMLSHYNKTAVAAVGNANQIINLLILTFGVISLATTILVSLYLGAKDEKKVSQIYTLALIINIVLGIAIAAAVILGNGFIFGLMNVPHELLKEAKGYLIITAAFLPVQAVFLTFSSIFKANTLMKKAMAVSVFVNIINIIGNALLINGIGPFPELGAAGGAISTSFSRLIGVIVVIMMFRKYIKNASISLRQIKPFPWDIFRKLVLIGLPSGGEMLSYNLSQIFILAFINTMGTAVITTKMYGTMFAWVAYVFALATSQASQIMVGYMIGAREYDKANSRTMKTLKWSTPVSVGIAFFLFLFSDTFFGFFTSDLEVLRLGKMILGVEVILEIGRTFNMVIIRALQAAGDVKFPVVIGVCSQWMIAVGLGYILGIIMGYGLVGLWIAMAIDECIRAIIFLIRWKSGIWKAKSMVS